jgi:4,5-DOPA dioxygenase extradiol
VVFVGHGASIFSMNEESPARKAWKEESKRIQEKHGKPKGIVCVSDHFVTVRHQITSADALQTIHDHPARELYSFEYPARTDLDFSNEIICAFETKNVPISKNMMQGIDHGAWIPLSAVFPHADVPVVLISLAEDLDLENQFRVGEILGNLPSKGYLILASGSATHNLGTFRSGYFSGNDANSADIPNLEFQEQLDGVLLATESDRVLAGITALTRSTLYPQVHPTPDQFVPLLVAD